MNEYYHEDNSKLFRRSLPANVTTIIFGYEFNQPVDNLPKSIKIIIFGFEFNQPVDNLPNSVSIIKFGGLFNQSVDKLPNSVSIIKFKCSFNQSVDKLPNSVSFIKFGYMFDKSVKALPKFVKTISLYCVKHKNVYNNFNIHLKKIIQKLPCKQSLNYSFGLTYISVKFCETKIKKLPYGCVLNIKIQMHV